MSIVYKITNQINGKAYIGQTSATLKERWEVHLRDAYKEKVKNRPLYRAIKKYGKENFSLEIIEENISQQEISMKEIYWIEFFHTYSNGYNATLGGEGKCFYDHTAILSSIEKGQTILEIQSSFGCCADTIRDIAKRNDLLITLSVHPSCKKIAQYDLEGNYLQTFLSLTEAAKWLVENKLSTVTNPTTSGSLKTHIGEVAKGKRKSAYKYIWKYA